MNVDVEITDINTLEVAHAAWWISHSDPFGAMHVVVEDGNMDDDNIRGCLSNNDVTDTDRKTAEILLALSEPEREAAFYRAGEMFGHCLYITRGAQMNG